MDEVLTRGRRTVRNRRIRTALAATMILTILAAVLIPYVREPAPPAVGNRPSLPDHLPGFSVRTAAAERSAPGRAIAVYGYGNGELINLFQHVVVGADTDRYRRLAATDQRGDAPALLSPDGTQVLVGHARRPTDSLQLVDLTSGRTRRIALGATLGVRLLAWSPDGRHVAYSTAPVGPSAALETDAAGTPAELAVIEHGTLRILDVTTGEIAEVATAGPPWQAAYSADGARLAVQIGQEVHLLRADGRGDGSIRLPDGRGLAPRVAWSPDGRLLATVPGGAALDEGAFLLDPGPLLLVPLAPLPAGSPPFVFGSSRPVAGPEVLRVLGWRDAGHIIAAVNDTQRHVIITEFDVTTGGQRILTRFDTRYTCELGLQGCLVFDLQLATGLLAELGVRPAGAPDRGPWPLFLSIPAALSLWAMAWLLWLLVGRLTTRRRRETG